MGESKTKVVSAQDIDRSLRRLAHEIIEADDGTEIVLVGIQTRGVPLAKRVSGLLREFGDMRVDVGALDISHHRDDRTAPTAGNTTTLPFDITDKTVILVDDVLFTGRTARAGLDALIDQGRPSAVRLAVLIDRGHRQLPIRPDHVGKNLPTSQNQRVNVRLAEVDGADAVELEEANQ